VKQRLRSVPSLAIAYGLAAASGFFLNICVGRGLGAAALGDFALAVASARIFYAATDLGVTAHMTRAVSRDRSQSQRFLAMALGFRVSLIPVAIVVCAISGTAFGRTDITMFGLVAVAQGMVTIQGLYEALLLAHERQGPVAGLTTATALCVALGAFLWLLVSNDLVLLALCYALCSAIAVSAWVAWVATRLSVLPRVSRPGRALQTELALSWPIGASMLFGIMALRAPLLVLGASVDREEVGAFSAVDMVVTASAILQAAVSSATFPRLAASYRRDTARFRYIFVASNVGLAAIGLVIAVFLVEAGAPLMTVVFPGKDFTHIVTVMPIVAWSTPALLLVHHNIYMFAASNMESVNVRFMGFWLAIIAVLQLVVVPSYGLEGAAWALLIARSIGLAVLAITIIGCKIHRGGDVDA
jgi:O-antigen/teichoic acid export membrane protein